MLSCHLTLSSSCFKSELKILSHVGMFLQPQAKKKRKKVGGGMGAVLNEFGPQNAMKVSFPKLDHLIMRDADI